NAAQEAAATAQKVFEEGGVGDDLPFITVDAEYLESEIDVVEMLQETGLCTSKGEAKRLIQGGGARINDVPVKSIEQKLSSRDLTDEGHIKLSSGKKHHALVKV
ncbi:MAG: tyrosine--tRNA ligase, partial [Alphaproteobacteria bacterium]|nr:tyrosine--tRNA ligase [Alphaproteobacteria bacterium]